MKFKCNENGKEFLGSSYTTECPECGSTDIEIVKSTSIIDIIIEKIKENKLISFLILVILIFILWPSKKITCDCGVEVQKQEECKEACKDIKLKYSLDFDTKNTDFCEVYLISEDGKRVAYNQPIYSFLNLKADLLDENGDEYSLFVDGNKILYCTEGDVTISYKTKSSNNSQSLGSMYKGSFLIKDVKPLNKNKNCIPKISLGEPSFDFNNCQIEVPIVQGGSNVFISINGQDGNFKNTTIFKINEINDKNFDIWYYPKGFKNQKTQYDFKNKEDILLEIADKKNNVNENKYNVESIKSDIKSALKLFNDKSNRITAENKIYGIADMYPGFEYINLDGKDIDVNSIGSKIMSEEDSKNKRFNYNSARVEVNKISIGCGSFIKIKVFIDRL